MKVNILSYLYIDLNFWVSDVIEQTNLNIGIIFGTWMKVSDHQMLHLLLWDAPPCLYFSSCQLLVLLSLQSQKGCFIGLRSGDWLVQWRISHYYYYFSLLLQPSLGHYEFPLWSYLISCVICLIVRSEYNPLHFAIHPHVSVSNHFNNKH